MNKQIVDFSIVGNGETGSKLTRILQEIEIIMVTEFDLITNTDLRLNLEQYLFKFGQDANSICSVIEKTLNDNIIHDSDYTISVDAKFLNGLQNKDTLLIDVSVNIGSKLAEKFTYAIQ
jgi:hypothetical protein